MIKTFILLVVFSFSITTSAQMQKLFNTKNPDNNYFGTSVSIWGNFVLIQNHEEYRLNHVGKYDLHIFEKDYNEWIEIQALKTYLVEFRKKNAVIYNDMIVFDNNFNYEDVKHNDYIYILKYNNNNKYFEYIDTAFISPNIGYSGFKSFYKDWFIITLRRANIYKTCFYHFQNDKWIMKDSFEYLYERAEIRGKSIIHDSIAISPFRDSIAIYKRYSDAWKLIQKLAFPPFYNPWYEDIFSNDISMSPDEKWIAGSATDSIGYPHKLTYLMIFKLVDAKWELSQTIRHVGNDSLAFGRAVNISDNELLIGAPLTNGGKGTIYQYTLQDDIWVLKGEIKPPPQDTFYGYFGSSIDRHGETVIVGADKDKTYDYAPGAAYIFQIPARDTLEVTICEGDSYTFGDKFLTKAGHYIDTLQASYGADSVVQLYLKVLPSSESFVDTVLCDAGNITIGDSVFTESGDFTVTLKNQNKCDSIINLHIDNSQLEIDTAYISPDYNCNVGKIEIVPVNSDGQYHFEWDNGNSDNPLSSLSSGDYSVTIRDKNGCILEKSYNVPDSIPYLIPNAFFPSGNTNDINNAFKIYKTKDVKIISAEIFNRWGEKVFHTTNNDEYWDGTFRGKAQPPGVYLYRIVIVSPCGEDTKTGQVMLLR